MKDWWQRLALAQEIASRRYRMQAALAARLVEQTAGLAWLALADAEITRLCCAAPY